MALERRKSCQHIARMGPEFALQKAKKEIYPTFELWDSEMKATQGAGHGQESRDWLKGGRTERKVEERKGCSWKGRGEGRTAKGVRLHRKEGKSVGTMGDP